MNEVRNKIISNFYKSNANLKIVSEISCKLRDLLFNKKILAIGFCENFLNLLEADELYYAVPESYELVRWPEIKPFASEKVDKHLISLRPCMWDVVMIIHYMEFSGKNLYLLSEISRILKNDGKLIVISVNKNNLNLLKNKSETKDVKFSLKEIISFIVNSSFSIKNILGINKKFKFWPYSVSYNLNRYNEILVNFYPLLSDVAMIIADKTEPDSETISPLKEQYEMT
ncbi:MAG: hypothetical protein LBS23_01795 [Holosporaceae bacterium]|jgi:hypothetical protein|nr:hypothetical protein [Holosporaceae bacterium]